MTLGADIATLVIDCAEVTPMLAMYRALGAVHDSRYNSDDTLLISGLTISFQQVADYTPPSWPDSATPSQMHLDFFVDSPDEMEAHLQQYGATSAPIQPHRANGLIVMLDPAGHPFCIGTRR